jgi:hypothetical protein
MVKSLKKQANKYKFDQINNVDKTGQKTSISIGFAP